MSQENLAACRGQLVENNDREDTVKLPVAFVSYQYVADYFKDKKVAVVGSAPCCLDNEIGFIDSHDIVVRINNYKNDEYTGYRTDVHYSFFGVSCRKTSEELLSHGVDLCLCKLPNENFIESNWHQLNNKQAGIDFERIYHRRKDWWFCDTYIPTKERLEAYMGCIKRHMPTTGFACLLDVFSFDCDVYITGFDFFKSQIHNVNEKWAPGDRKDPIGHKPDLELQWLKDNKTTRMTFDKSLQELIKS